MLDLFLTVLSFGSLYLALGLFGYYSALGHVNRLLDIEEPDSPPSYIRNAKRDFGEQRALSVSDIDEIDHWDDWEE